MPRIRFRSPSRPAAAPVLAYATLYQQSFTATSLGAEWTTSGYGGARTVDVNGYALRMLTGATGAFLDGASATLGTGTVYTNNLRTRLRFKLGQATSCYYTIYMRDNGAGTSVFWQANGTANTWSISKSVAGSVNVIGSPVSKTWDTTNWFWVEFELVDSTIRARVWRDDAQRPLNWEYEQVDPSVLAAGRWTTDIENGSTGVATSVLVDDIIIYERCVNETNYAARTHITPEAYGYTAGATAAVKQTALQNAVAAVIDNTKTLYLAAGVTYDHNNVLQFLSSGATISGTGTLHATDTTGTGKTAISFLAPNQGAEDITVTADGTVRAGAFDDHTINAGPGPPYGPTDKADNLILRDVKVASGTAVGIFLYGIANYRLYRPQVRNTLADTIHQTHGCSGGIVYDSWCEDGGDDGVAVVSLDADPTTCTGIDVYRPVVFRGAARGLAVVGGANVRYYNVYIDTTVAAGVYIFAESAFATRSVSAALVSYGTIKRANTAAGTTHGYVLIGQDNPSHTVTGVTIEHLAFQDRPATTSANYFARIFGASTTIVINDIKVPTTETHPSNMVVDDTAVATVTNVVYV